MFVSSEISVNLSSMDFFLVFRFYAGKRVKRHRVNTGCMCKDEGKFVNLLLSLL